MTCPNCGCSETHVYDPDHEGGDDYFRCAACNAVFSGYEAEGLDDEYQNDLQAAAGGLTQTPLEG